MRSRVIRAIPSGVCEELRREAIQAILNGKTQTEVAEVCGVTRQAVSKWVKAYREKGEGGLRTKHSGRPKGTSLFPVQARQVAKLIMNYCPEQLGLPLYLWTREAVTRLIEQRFGVQFSMRTVSVYLKRWGLTPQRPVCRGFQRNSGEVPRWFVEEYPKIQKQARRERALIYWGDAVDLEAYHVVVRSNNVRGESPVIITKKRRSKLYMISAVTNHGQFYFMIVKMDFCSRVFLEFLSRLVQQSPRKVFLIIDDHIVSQSIEVKSWIEKNGYHIRLFSLSDATAQLNFDGGPSEQVKSKAAG